MRLLRFSPVVLVLVTTAALAAPRRERQIDHLWAHPDPRSIRLTAVAMLPAVGFDDVVPAEHGAELELMKLIKDSGYRWVSPATSRDMLRAAGGESLLLANKQDILAHGRIDSLRVATICAKLRVNGLLTIRLDRAEQVSIQSDQSGKPTTTVQVSAAMVDSLGRRVWSASGTQVAEGPEMQGSVTGVGGSGVGGVAPSAVVVKSNAPDWPFVYGPMFDRWVKTFPPRARMAGGAAADSSAR